MTLFNKIEALYWSSEGVFDFTCPLKMYHGYSVDKIAHASTTLQKLALRLAHVATGIFAYPILGAFAALSMGLKLLFNHVEKPETFQALFCNTHEFPARGLKAISVRGATNIILKKFNIKFGPTTRESEFDDLKRKYVDEMAALSKLCNSVYQQLSYTYSGSWQDGLEATFYTTDSNLPYCANILLPTYEEVTYSPPSTTLFIK